MRIARRCHIALTDSDTQRGYRLKMEKQAKETQSTPLFTTRALFALIWPMLMEQFLSITMGMADTFMVSGVGEQLFPVSVWWTVSMCW
jgi:Na+-driven multidrug efflux pump